MRGPESSRILADPVEATRSARALDRWRNPDRFDVSGVAREDSSDQDIPICSGNNGHDSFGSCSTSLAAAAARRHGSLAESRMLNRT
jgi:hypothetical protein